MNVPSYPFYSLSLKLPNKRMDFSFSPLKLPNKGREKYSNIILFIPLHSIPFHFLFPNEGLKRFCYLWKFFMLDYMESGFVFNPIHDLT